MFYMICMVLTGSAFFVTIRISKTFVHSSMVMYACNYLTCAAIAVIYGGLPSFCARQEGLDIALYLGMIGGTLYVLSICLIDKNIRESGVVLTTLFSRLGLMVPLLLSTILFGECITSLQLVGILIAFLAILLMHSETQTGRAIKFRLKAALVFLLFVNGFSTGTLKVYDVYGVKEFADAFLLVIFFSAFVYAIVLAIFRRETLGWREVLFGSAIGLFNFHTSKFVLLALGKVPSVIVFPVQSVGVVVLTCFISLLFFRERLSRNQWIAVGLCLIALLLINKAFG